MVTWQQTEKLRTEVFGWSAFRGQQEAALKALIEGRDVLAVMPTGSGKSLIYQMAAAWGKGLVLVVSPLIALMNDQVRQAQHLPFKVAALHSGLGRQKREAILRELTEKKINLLYVTPERFRQSEFWQALEGPSVFLLAIDEAHCISQWGQDFRPEYSRLADVRERLKPKMTLALTATATPKVRADILQQLQLHSSMTSVFVDSIARRNLGLNFHEVYGFEEKLRALVGLQHAVNGSQICYFSLISSLEEAQRQLQRLGIPHVIYHGQLEDRFRQRQQDDFLDGRVPLILATPAFGLGVNKSDVRVVYHWEIPGSVESYYQEIGRGGRDGLPAEAHLFYDADDIQIQMDFLKWSQPDPGFIRSVFRLLKDHLARFKQEGPDFLRAQMNFYNRRDFRVETALNLLDRWDVIRFRDRKVSEVEIIGDLPEEYLDQDLYKQREKGLNEKLYQMMLLVKEADCRMQFIHNYFAEPLAQPCGQCDNCKRMS